MRRKGGSLAAIAVGLGLSFFVSTTAAAPGSLAVNKCGTYGYSFGKGSVGEAEKVALQECGPGCNVLHFENACGAFATDPDQSCRAEEIALNECANRGGGNCSVKRWVCDGQ